MMLTKQIIIRLFRLSRPLIVAVLLIIFTTCRQDERKDFELPDKGAIPQLIRKSNIVYDLASFQTGIAHVPPYIANGIIGGCFDHLGFQSTPSKGTPNGRTVLGYIGHYYMHEPTTRQAQLPLAYLQAAFADGSPFMNMMDIDDYRQELDIYTGVLTTTYDLFGYTNISAFAHQTIPNLFVMKINRRTSIPGKELILNIHCQTATTQQGNIDWPPAPVKLEFDIQGHVAHVVSSTNMVDTRWTVYASDAINQTGGTLHIPLAGEESLLYIQVHRDGMADVNLKDLSYPELLKSHTEAWASNWERSWVDFPDARAHHIWNRANYYNLSNFPVIAEKALIPTGMNTNIWGFTFPQDVYYVAENLLRSGHFDKYEKAMQYWLDILPEVKKYSRRIMQLEGGYYPWTPPFDRWDDFEKEGPVSTDSYQIHNPAYVSAMVWHYYQRTGNLAFLRKYFPIMEEVWRFYNQVLHKSERGTYDVYHHTATSQDEAFRETDLKNYLDASYSAEYTARNYLAAAVLVSGADQELVAKARVILDAGLERAALLNQYGYYNTFEGDDRPKNSQKHPLQLNAITFCPMSEHGISAPSIAAYINRYDLTTEARKPVSHGWTYAAFALASSRLGDYKGLASDLSAIQYCSHADPRWIQFYEYTFWERWTLATAYYFPTQGLYQQALTDALVQDWQGHIEIFACMMDDWRNERISFKGLHTLNGISVDGVWDNGEFRVVLNPSGAKEIDIRVSSGQTAIKVSGHKAGPDSFKPAEIIRIVFEGNNPVILSNV